jgi:hypothetical protein
LLVPPALLKMASTEWRIARYYTGNSGHHQAGTNHPAAYLRAGCRRLHFGGTRRWLVLIFVGRDSSGTVLFTGLFTGLGQRVNWLTMHQGLAIVWGVLTGLHVLARSVGR